MTAEFMESTRDGFSLTDPSDGPSMEAEAEVGRRLAWDSYYVEHPDEKEVGPPPLGWPPITWPEHDPF